LALTNAEGLGLELGSHDLEVGGVVAQSSAPALQRRELREELVDLGLAERVDVEGLVDLGLVVETLRNFCDPRP
jgi:hypothetical protein